MMPANSFRFGSAPTIEARVALGREQNSMEDGAIVPFPDSWDPDALTSSFRPGGGTLLFKAINDENFKLGTAYYYHDSGGAIIGLVQRLDHPSKKKIVIPIRSSRVVGCNPFLEIKAINEPRPLYNLHNLTKAETDIWIMVTEGEKAAEAARILFADHVVTTWSGGCKAAKQADLRPLAGRRVVIWPDHDKPGWDATKELGQLLQAVGVAELRVVQTPDFFPAEWDLADPVPEQAHG